MSVASEIKNLVCEKCGSPMWEIKDAQGELTEYSCLNGHVSAIENEIAGALKPVNLKNIWTCSGLTAIRIIFTSSCLATSLIISSHLIAISP